VKLKVEESVRTDFKDFLKKLEMPKDGQMISEGRRVAIKDLLSVVQMLRYSAENMSQATVGVVLTRIGGLIASKEIEDLKTNGEDLVKSCLRGLSIKGWGLFNATPDRNGGDVTLKNSAIAQEYDVKGSKVDYIAVGMITTIYEKAFNHRYLVREVECTANGDKVCKFKVKPI
jgi:predicted hydrocarbon binding protein